MKIDIHNVRSVVMLCMGNICRSPTAEVVLKHKLVQAGLADRVQVSSAGTHSYHVGGLADARSARHAARRGYDLSPHRAQQLVSRHFEQADLILAMDHDNLALALERCPPQHRHKLCLLMSLVEGEGARAVPDPYHGGDAGFEEVLDMAEAACDALIRGWQRKAQPGSAA
jgi:protein-tyrosine phosphatase